jgi:hypothetical protein
MAKDDACQTCQDTKACWNRGRSSSQDVAKAKGNARPAERHTRV